MFNTVFEILSGFSKTSLCVSEEPIVVTTPSPTRAIIVASPAPPTSLSKFALTVTLAFALNSIPSLAIAATIGEERDTLEDVVEPYLLQQGFLRRTKRGREVTTAAYEHLGIEPK